MRGGAGEVERGRGRDEEDGESLGEEEKSKGARVCGTLETSAGGEEIAEDSRRKKTTNRTIPLDERTKKRKRRGEGTSEKERRKREREEEREEEPRTSQGLLCLLLS